MKRIFSIILIWVLLLSIIQPPGIGYAVGTGMNGSGTEQDPFIVTTAEELNQVRDNLNAFYKLGNDIDLSNYPNWEPIGDYSSGPSFRGSFDGDNHTISGLTIDSQTYGLGLFGSVETNATIKNVHLKNASVKGQFLIGSLVGYNKGTISNSSSENGTIQGTSHQIGGLIGSNSGPVSDSHASGNVTGGSTAGGLIGISDKTISRSYSTGTVTGTDQVGGLVGTSSHGGIITDSYSQANVKGTTYVGGLNGINNGSIKTSYGSGKVEGNSYVGGLVGFSNGGYVTSGYYDQQTSGQSNYGNGTPMSTVDMKKKTTFTSAYWDFSNIWTISDGQYPTLHPFGYVPNYEVTYNANGATAGDIPVDDSGYKNGEAVSIKGNTGNLEKTGFAFNGWNTTADGSGTNYKADETFNIGNQSITLYANWKAVFTMNGSGTEQDPYIITTADELNSVRNDLTAHFKLGNNIDLSSYINWQPIGTYNAGFRGSFDGANHTITELKMNSNIMGTGLFSSIYSGGAIRNTFLESVSVTGTNIVGSLVGINNGTISNSGLISGTIHGSSAIVGGLVGTNNGIMSDSYAKGTVTGANNEVGGLVGENRKTISKSYSDGNVTAIPSVGSYFGGLVGYNMSGTVSDSYSTSNVSARAYGAGLVGVNTGNGSIRNSYAIGNVAGTNTGGLIALNSGYASISNSFYDKETTNQVDSGKGNGLSTAEMQKISTFTDAGWDFDYTWENSGNSYPSLQPFEMIKTYRVKYNENGATEGSVPSDGTKYKKEDNVTVKGNTDNLAKTGFIFNGWNTKADGTGASFAEGDSFTMKEETITLYAQWKDPNAMKGSGTEVDPYLVTTAEQLNKVRDNLTAHYKLENDINLSGFTNWQPIGDFNTGKAFTGELDGAGYNITNLRIERTDVNYAGLFAYIGMEGSIHNIGLENVNIIGSDYVGGLAGNNDGAISYSHVTGKVSGRYSIGGIVGSNRSTANMNNNYANVDVFGLNKLGGLAGENSSLINNSYALGAVTGNYYVGGLVGINQGGSTVVKNSYSIGAVTGSMGFGGLVGLNYGSVISSYYNQETSSQSDIGKGEPLSTVAMQKKDSYTAAGWDFNSIWGIKTGQYPSLYPFGTMPTYFIVFDTDGGSNVVEQSVKENESVSKPEMPKKEGYSFVGWYSDKELTVLYDFEKPVTSDATVYAKWEINEYQVNFDTNGGSEVAAETVKYNEKAVIPETPTKEGYTLVSWYSDKELTELYDFEKPVTSDVILYAKWEMNEYQVKFNTNGGSKVAAATVKYNENAVTPEAPTKEGYTFVGWYSDSMLENQYDFESPVKADVTLFANWTINEYKVNFDTDGGSKVTSATVKFNEKAITPEAPTKEGYTFAGWYSDDQLETQYDFESPIKADVTLFAKWTINEYQVNFDTDGGSKVTSATVKFNEKAAQPEAPTREGYTFAGWYSDSKLETQYDFESPVKADVTLFAKWTINEYKVNFDTDGGSKVTSATVKFNEKISTPEAPTKEGYTFAGWYSDSKFETQYDFESPVKADVTLYAKWTINEYKVNFDTDGGSKVTSATVKFNEKATSPEAPTKEGYTFAGWYSDSKFETQYDFESPVKAEVTVYAKWTINEYQVNFDTDEGSKVASETVKFNEKATSPEAPTKEGYTFVGWYSDSKLETQYDFESPVKAEVTVYAKWTINEYQVNFDTDGGSKVASETVKFNEKAVQPEAPTKEGYTFAGWYSDSKLTKVYDFEKSVTTNQTLYVKWISANNTLAAINLSNNISLTPTFDKEKTTYTASVKNEVTELTITFLRSEIESKVQINEQLVDNSSSEATIPLSVGENMIKIKVTAPDGVSEKTYSLQVTRAEKPKDVTKEITIDVVSDNKQDVLAQTKVQRTTFVNGKITDLVNLTLEDTKNVLEKLENKVEKVVTLFIPDSNDEVSETKVEVPSNALQLLGQGGSALQIQTNDVNIFVPNKSIADFNKDLYFRVVPVKNEADKKIIEEQAKQEQMVKAILQDSNSEIQALGRPMEIETNMQNHLVTIMLPLPTDVSLTTEMLDNLAVFIQHSDGTKEVLPGIIVKDESGNLNIQFDVTKFSTFTVMYMEGASKYFADDVIDHTTGEEITDNTATETVTKNEQAETVKDEETKESALPDTASNSYNWLLFGSFLVLIGLIGFFLVRRRFANNK